MKNLYRKIRSQFIFGTVLLVILTFFSCSGFLEIDPPQTETVNANVYASNASAISAVRGIYSLMMTNSSFTNGSLEEMTGIASDELLNYGNRADQIQFYQNTLTPNNTDLLSLFWSAPYKYISNANAVLEGLEQTNNVSTSTKRQLEGQAKFIRAFSHFYLTALFGEIPYLKSTDYRINQKAPRSTLNEIYGNLINDLKDAETLLNDTYSFSGDERIEPNRGAATALLARVYLYSQEWAKAEAAASSLINNTSLYQLTPNLNQVFLASSRETIWQLKPVEPGINTNQARIFTLNAAPNASSRRVSLRENFRNSFNVLDNRRQSWIGQFTSGSTTWYYPSKYKVLSSQNITEQNVVLRLAEQFLIRAEARTHLNNLLGGEQDLNMIRNRAGLASISLSDKEILLDLIDDERKHELFAEWGHRWLYMKRSGKITSIMSSVKNGWKETNVLFPIPASERLLNPNLTQNPGY